MNEKELKRLIGRYYDGVSTAEEEGTLRDYFRGTEAIPDGYEAEKVIFSYYDDSQEIPEPSHDFEAQIMAALDASEKKNRSQQIKRYIIPLLSAAAGLLILAGSYFLLINRPDASDTFSDPEIAYAETIKILRDVSSQINHAAQVLEPVGKINEMTLKSFETINKSTRIVERNLKNLDYLKKVIDLTHVPVEKNKNK